MGGGAKNGAGEGVNSGFCSDVISKELCLGAARGGSKVGLATHTHTRTGGDDSSRISDC